MGNKFKGMYKDSEKNLVGQDYRFADNDKLLPENIVRGNTPKNIIDANIAMNKFANSDLAKAPFTKSKFSLKMENKYYTPDISEFHVGF